jgi:hypothetical protein
MFDLVAYLKRQWDWSARTFGPGPRTGGVTRHIEKECAEIRACPLDLEEWVDVQILSFDGFWRAAVEQGYSIDRATELLIEIHERKQEKNFARQWPDWRTLTQDDAIEHDRSGECQTKAAHPARYEDFPALAEQSDPSLAQKEASRG